MENIVLTNDYLRNNIIDTYKLRKISNNNDNNNDVENGADKFVMTKGLNNNSKKELDIKPSVVTNKTNKKITRVNIDSAYRNVESKNVLDNNIYYLENNPIDIISNSLNDTDLIIHHKNHPFLVNDHIIIQGVTAKHIILSNALTFTVHSSYVKVNHLNHGIDFTTNNIMQIEIQNFIGNINNESSFFNVPINFINSLHTIYASTSSLEIGSNDYYYINLGNILPNFTGTYNSTSINIFFKDINGINLNLINSNYPTSVNQLSGFQIIYYTDPNYYKIKLSISNSITINRCGNNSVWVAKVIDFMEGYKYNNYYKISLKKTFYNISRIKLVSTEFPNTEKVIKSIPINKKNNAFYWKLGRDGNYVYSVELNPGNYTISLLQSELKKLIQNVFRPNIEIINNNTTAYSYLTYNLCNITLESNTDTFSIEFFTTILVPRSITYIAPANFTDNNGRLIINHPNHALIVGINITIINATGTDGIPQEVLNNVFTIEEVIDENTYQLKLPKYNTSSSSTTTNGGTAMGIIFPVKSQLLFNKPDTIGSLIGFRNSGNAYSFTKFNYINTNRDLYMYDNIDLTVSYTNNSINLSGYNYILMSCPLFKESCNTGTVDYVFAKLLLSGDPGSILYNQYVQLGETFTYLIPSLSDWEIYFYDPAGNLYDFGNLEHSYTLEIHEDLD